MKEREKWEENYLNLSQFSITDFENLGALTLNGSYPVNETKLQRKGIEGDFGIRI